MSGKSRRRGRHLPRSKKRKGGRGFTAPAASAPAVAQKFEPPPRAETPVPSVKVPTPKAIVAQHRNVAAELRRIGILAGIIVVILVILAFVLPHFLA